MLEIIYGKRGSGKTKKLISQANTSVKDCVGDIVYIDDDNRCMLDLNHTIRFMSTDDYMEFSPCLFVGFLCGVLASDYDIKEVYIDGMPKLVGLDDVSKLEDTIDKINTLAQKFNILVKVSISGEIKNMPDFIKPYITQ